MRAREPDFDGYVERDGVKVAYEVFGDGNRPTVLLMPTWSIVHSRVWKAQVAYLARHYRVVTFDGRGNGRSDRPPKPTAYTDAEFVEGRGRRARRHRAPTGPCWSACRWADCGTAARRATSRPGPRGRVVHRRPCRLATERPTATSPRTADRPFDAELDVYEGWAKYNRHYWLTRLRRLPRSSSSARSSPSPTRPSRSRTASAGRTRPTARRWSHDPRRARRRWRDRAEVEAMCALGPLPVLVVHGDRGRHHPARERRPRSPS